MQDRTARRSTRRFATLPSGPRLHYRIQGNPEGPWIVLINGLLSDTTMWAGVLPGLASRFHVLTFDCRGQGHSDAPGEGAYPPGLLAEDAWALFGLLGIARPWLLGLSNGSNISLELLAAHPGAFPGAVLTSSVPCVDLPMRLKILHWIQCLQVGGPLMQFDAAAPYLWGDRFLETRHGVLRAFHEAIAGGRGDLRSSEGVDAASGLGPDPACGSQGGGSFVREQTVPPSQDAASGLGPDPACGSQGGRSDHREQTVPPSQDAASGLGPDTAWGSKGGRSDHREQAVPPSQYLAALRQMEGLLEWDIRDRLGAVDAPVLVLSGAEDLLTPPWKCLETARRLPHARFEVVPGVGHALPVEEPKIFTSHVLEFIGTLADMPITRG